MGVSSSYKSLVLASASPRRIELLTRSGVPFTAVESGVAEVREPLEPAARFALRMARAKAAAVSAQMPHALVLGADTVVEIEGDVLGKPRDRADARRMITLLAGREHRVMTGFALFRARSMLEEQVVTSTVEFRPLGQAEIEQYIATDEPYDKAGAYGVQGLGRVLIARVEGSLANVMGLPIEEVLDALARQDVVAARAC